MSLRSAAAATSALVLVGAATACAAILDVQEPLPANAETPDTGAGTSTPAGDDAGTCVGEGCPCRDDSTCRPSAFAFCVEGRCSECRAAPDTCPGGEYCLPPIAGSAGRELGVCVPGCSSDATCAAFSSAAPHCALARHQCVSCVTESDCTNAAQSCSPSGRCVEQCPSGAGCLAGTSCCGLLCVDWQTDVFNCGSCGNACTGDATLCCDGHCVDPTTDLVHCGLCSTSCDAVVANAAGATCVAAKCTYASCAAGHADCDRDRANGCECAR